MSLLLAPDIRSWTLSRMTSFSLATISKGKKVLGVGFCPFFGMHRTAIYASTDIGEVVDWIRSKFSVTKEGIPQWGTWEKLPSAHPTGAECPKRGGLRKGDCGPHPSTADLLNHATLGFFFLVNAALVITTVAVM